MLLSLEIPNVGADALRSVGRRNWGSVLAWSSGPTGVEDRGMLPNGLPWNLGDPPIPCLGLRQETAGQATVSPAGCGGSQSASWYLRNWGTSYLEGPRGGTEVAEGEDR